MNHEFHPDLADALNTVCAKFAAEREPQVDPCMHLMAAIAVWLSEEQAHQLVRAVYTWVAAAEKLRHGTAPGSGKPH
jgi:hypothetical protein